MKNSLRFWVLHFFCPEDGKTQLLRSCSCGRKVRASSADRPNIAGSSLDQGSVESASPQAPGWFQGRGTVIGVLLHWFGICIEYKRSAPAHDGPKV